MTGAFAFIITGFFFLPMFFELKTTSIYEYFEHRFHSRTMRRMCATIFILNTVFYMSVVIYAPSVALSGLTNVGTWVFILVVGSVGTLYTTIGGLKAVVWADTLQAFFMYSGVGVLIIKGVNDAGGLERIWHVAIESGRVGDLNRWNPDP
uniref:Sodium-dependent multivitamin transporter n=1 Tax=Plectus sambesii TaxID=2011161 RepID=A0A914VSE1_9BILA